MRRREHPLSHAIYEVDDDGLITVVAADGRQGRFTTSGQWVEGELHQADPHLCGWLSTAPSPRGEDT